MPGPLPDTGTACIGQHHAAYLLEFPDQAIPLNGIPYHFGSGGYCVFGGDLQLLLPCLTCHLRIRRRVTGSGLVEPDCLHGLLHLVVDIQEHMLGLVLAVGGLILRQGEPSQHKSRTKDRRSQAASVSARRPRTPISSVLGPGSWSSPQR